MSSRLQVKALEDATTAARMQLKFLDGIAQGYAKEAWVGSAQGQANVDSWRSALAVLADGATQAQTTIRNTEPALRDAQAELSRLQSAKWRTCGVQRREEMVVSASVAAPSAGTR